MLFLIKTLNNRGSFEYSIVEFDNENKLYSNYEMEKKLLISVRKIPKWFEKIILSFDKKQKKSNIIELLDNLHLIVKNGLPLRETLLELADETKDKSFKKLLQYTAKSINEGKSFSDAFMRYKEDFGNIVINLIKIGEETGKLDFTIKRSSDFLKKTEQLKKKTKSALIYPVIAFLAALGSMMVWIIYVLPQMVDLFKTMDIKLPPVTVFVINSSHFLSKDGIFLIEFLVTFIVMVFILKKKNEKIKYYFDLLLMKTPIIKDVIVNFNIAFITEYLYLSTLSGIPMVTALNLLSENIDNRPFNYGLKTIKNEIERGKNIAVVFKDSNLFTPFVIRMVRIGTETGELDEQFEKISTYYHDKVDNFAENIGKIIEPIILLFVGIFVLIIVIALMGPMYDMMSNIP